MYPRIKTLAPLVLCISLPVNAADTKIYADTTDAAKIYTLFIDKWTGKKKSPLNIAIIADASTTDELTEFSKCTDNSVWAPAEQIDDLSQLFVGLSYLHFVDPNKWTPNDPERLIAQGQSVDSGVRRSIDSGLLSFSAVAFNQKHTLAAFSFSFICGGLCGNGSKVIFKRTSKRWVQMDKRCGGWIS